MLYAPVAGSSTNRSCTHANIPRGALQHPQCAVSLRAQVGAVVVGFDRHLNYYKIQYATLCISENPGCHFIATNLDARTHLTDAQEWAGNGAMVGAIKGTPSFVDFVLKPHPCLATLRSR